MSNKKDEALKLALEALKKCDAALAEELAAWDIDPPLHHVQEASNACGPAITAIREALAEQPEHDDPIGDAQAGLIAEQATRPCKPLTDEEIMEMYDKVGGATWISDFARAIEAAHGIKGDA